MSEQADVLVIGGGVIGVCAAYELAGKGASVTLLEREPDICPPESAVHANCGLVVPSEVDPLAAPGVLGQGLRWLLDGASPFYIRPRLSPALARWLWLFRAAATEDVVRRHAPVLHGLSVSGAALHAELGAEHGERWAYARRGWLAICESAGAQAEAETAAESVRRHGVEVEVLSAEDVRARVPQVRTAIAGGTCTPGDAHLDPAAFTRELAALAEARGATMLVGAEAYGFEQSGARVTRVLTTRGPIAADQVVIAAGAWSPHLTRQLGLRLPIEPAKGYSVDVPRPDGWPDTPLYITQSHVVVTPLPDVVRLGGTLELAGWDMTVRQRRVAGMRRAAERVLGLPADGPVRRIWRGPRPLTPDGLPVIGRSPRHTNVILATGHCMLGLSLGPITGMLVAEIAAGETPSHDLGPLRPDRF